eukprot:CAMPEP_0172749768 /NCGR_PEP_ID=MMETSP1074-20121228/148113_1 /TAXON_ID=2916 /ORGANISM="Ceratium fusus, Strain PA161109" /LENGTH=76 /DNA_ID=CAMNT_0013581785 /DNA_START=216 /DNA_END=446 /DNA_ORIENTATION=-
MPSLLLFEGLPLLLRNGPLLLLRTLSPEAFWLLMECVTRLLEPPSEAVEPDFPAASSPPEQRRRRFRHHINASLKT